MTKHEKPSKLDKWIKYYPVEGVYKYQSKTDPSCFYQIVPPTYPNTNWHCECKGFFYRKQCSHVEKAKRLEELRINVPGIHERLI